MVINGDTRVLSANHDVWGFFHIQAQTNYETYKAECLGYLK